MARPDLSYLKNLVLTLTGIACGIWSGMTGMSAAIPFSPSLAWLLGTKEPRLNAASILVTCATSVTALIAFGQIHMLDLPLIIIFAIASTAGALLGTLPIFADVRDTPIARRVWQITLLAIGVCTIVWSHNLSHSTTDTWTLSGGGRPANWIAAALSAALAAGFYGRLSSSGPAAILPVMLFLDHLGVIHAIATALCVYLVVSIGPAGAYVSQGILESIPIAWPMFGAAIGGLVGSRIAVESPVRSLVITYAIGVVALALGMLAIKPKSQESQHLNPQ